MDADEYIDYISKGAYRIQNLIDDILTFSQINIHGRPFTPTNCSEILNNLNANFQNAYDENAPELIYESLPTVMADKKQLVKVFIHLIDNAIKFCDEPLPKIHIQAETRENDYLFLISDNGIGIDPQYFDKIFMIFQRLHINSKYQGTGVGLALCKKIIERHCGKIWLESEEGKGSTFYFTIPIKGETP
ncbi:GHKL domain-containing protein [candidate division KSB1 bacterium]|nr:GHKL domain-containing protein [candidate division KSB1 bacterium]